MAKGLYGVLVCSLQLALVSAIKWTEASSTGRSRSLSVTTASLGTTAASLATHTPHFDIPSNYEPPHICGYVDYDLCMILPQHLPLNSTELNLGNSYTCADDNTCLWNSKLRLVGCGNPTSINYITSCVPHRSLQYCDSSCFANPSIIRWYLPSPHLSLPRVTNDLILQRARSPSLHNPAYRPSRKLLDSQLRIYAPSKSLQSPLSLQPPNDHRALTPILRR
jgi:hypothetical protein